MDITLGEQLLLLSLDDEKGTAKESARTGWAIAGAALLELALAGRIGTADERVVVRDPSPVGEPGLDEALARIVAWSRRRTMPPKIRDCVHHVHGTAVAGANRGLRERGLVREETSKVLGIFPVRRYPEADDSVEAALRRRLEAVVLGGEEPDERVASLVALLHGAELHRLAFPDADEAAVKSRMEEISRGQWAGAAVREAVEAMQAAVIAALVATVVVTTVS